MIVKEEYFSTVLITGSNRDDLINPYWFGDSDMFSDNSFDVRALLIIFFLHFHF